MSTYSRFSDTSPIWLLAQDTGAGHYSRCRSLSKLLAEQTNRKIEIFWRTGSDVLIPTVRPMPDVLSLVSLSLEHRPALVVGDGILMTKALAAIRISVGVPTCLVLDYLRNDDKASPDEAILVQNGCSKVLLACPKNWVPLPARYANLKDRFRQCLPCVSKEILDFSHCKAEDAKSDDVGPIIVLTGSHKVEVDLAHAVVSMCEDGGLTSRVQVLVKPGEDSNPLPCELQKFVRTNLSAADYASKMACSSIVIGTAGMNLIAECLVLRKRAILVAKPTADQFANGNRAKQAGLYFLSNGILDLSLTLLLTILKSPKPDLDFKCDFGESIVNEVATLLNRCPFGKRA